MGWIWQDDIFAIRYPSPSTGKLCPLFLFFGVSGFTRPLNTFNSPLKAFVVRKHGRLPSEAKNKCADAKINSAAERSNKKIWSLILSFCPVPDTGTDATVAGFIFGVRRSSPFRPLPLQAKPRLGQTGRGFVFSQPQDGGCPLATFYQSRSSTQPPLIGRPRPSAWAGDSIEGPKSGGRRALSTLGQRVRALPVPHQVS